jgi:hypothetical protein
MRHYKLLADRPDFVDEFYKIDACLKLGRDLLAGGSTRLGRNYISKSATYGRDAGFGQKYMNNLVLELKRHEIARATKLQAVPEYQIYPVCRPTAIFHLNSRGASQRQTFQISAIESGKCSLTGRLWGTQKFSTIQALLSSGVGISKIPCRPSGD